jgi:hypothetical protein
VLNSARAAWQGVRMYSFVKEGQYNKGERSEEYAVIESGMTFRVSLKDFMYEAKKSETMQVFPADLDEIPAFSVVEIMICPSNTKAFGEGYGFHLGRVRPCDFTLYSMQTALGLSLLPGTYEESAARADAWAEANPALRKVLECKNTGFFGRAMPGSYVVKYGEGVYRFVGPKISPDDPESTHHNVLAGGVYAVDIRKDVLLRFTNAVDADEEDSLRYACCLLDLASSAGALDFYVVHNEYLLRTVSPSLSPENPPSLIIPSPQDPNRSPFTGVPLIDTKALLKCIDGSTAGENPAFPLPFSVHNMDEPRFVLESLRPISQETGRPVECRDLVLSSADAEVQRGYSIALGDACDPEIMRFLFTPKRAGGQTGLDRMDYRAAKRARA